MPASTLIRLLSISHLTGWRCWLVLALLLLLPASAPRALAQVVSNPSNAANTAAFIQTVWGGGVAGNSPGNASGLLGVASLSSAGPSAWMGQSFYDWSASTHYLVSSAHSTSIQSFCHQSLSGLTTYVTFDATSTIKAVTGDGSGSLWVADTGRGVIRARYYFLQWMWQSAYVSWTFRSASAPMSLLYDAANANLYFTDSSIILRAPSSNSGALLFGVGAVAQVVASLTAVSSLTWSSDQKLIFLIDAGAVKCLNTSSLAVTLLAPAAAFTNLTALSLLPDGVSLLVADLQPGGYSVLKRVTLNPVTVSVHAANAANSSCTGAGNTYQGGVLTTACWGVIHAMSLGAGVTSGQVFVSEANTGRLKVIDYPSGGRVFVKIGGGAANNGYSSASSVPSGWAPGQGHNAFFEHSATAIIFDSTGTQGYLAEPAHGLLRSLNVVTMRADTLLGDGAFGNPAYTGTGQVGAVAGNVRLPAITAITKDSRDNLYWTDALGGVRSYNTSSGVTSNYCAVPTNASSCIRLSGSAPSTSTTYNCSRLCLGSATTGLAMDVSSRIVYVAYNDTQGVGSVLLSILPSGVALWWCGVGVNGAGNGVDSKCQQTELFAPQHLQVYGGALFYLEPSVPYVGWVSLTYTGNHSNGGALLSCSGSSRRGGGSSCPSWTGSTALTSPSAMAVDSSTGWLYLAEINSIVVCQITGGTNPTCTALSLIVGDLSTNMGYLDGFVTTSVPQFASVNSLYFDPVQSQLWLADGGNNRIRTLQTLTTSGSAALPIITALWPLFGPMSGSIAISLTGLLFQLNTQAYFGTSSSSAAAYTQCASTSGAGSAAVLIVCTISATQAASLLSTQQPVFFAAFSNAPQAAQALISPLPYQPNWCYADTAGTSTCTGGLQCNATAKACYSLPLATPAVSRPPSSSSSTSPPPSSSISSSVTSSPRRSSSAASSSLSSSRASSSVSSSLSPSSSLSSSLLTSAPVASSSLPSTADSSVSSSQYSSSDSSSDTVDGSKSSTADSSSSSADVSSSPAYSSPFSSSLSSSAASSSLSSSPASSSFSSSLSSSLSSSAASSSVSSSPFSSSVPSSSSSSSSSAPAPPPPPPFSVSTITPASLVASSDVVVNLTGVWLPRVTAVYVSGQSLPFRTYGPYSPWTDESQLSSGNDDSGGSGRWSVDSVREDEADGAVWATYPHALHSFHPYQSSSGSCEPPSCLAGLELLGGDNSVLSFTLPASNSSGYLPMSLSFLPVPVVDDPTLPPPVLTNWTGSDWLYSTPVPCTTGWLIDGDCAPCPTGGYCPGGGRVWPLPGYWSYSETTLPVACGLAQSCPGALSSPQLATDGSRETCVCAAGYTGTFCALCAADYYALEQRCLSCGLEDTEKMELGILVIIAVALFVAMACCVATLSATGLSMAVAAILLVQHFSVVGKLAGQQVPEDLTWLVTLFTITSMLNFDVTFVKPGCVVAALSFLTVYWITLALVVGTSGLFALASFIRAKWWQLRDARQADGEAEGRRAERIPWHWRFRARLIHSHLILGSILYLRVSTMTLQALHCTDVQVDEDGSVASVLLIDLTTRCYQGPHLATALLMAWPTLFAYCLGFPLFTAYLLYKAFHGAARKAVESGEQPPLADGEGGEAAASSKAKSLPVFLFHGGEGTAVEMSAAGAGGKALMSPLAGSSSGLSSPVAVSAPTSPMVSPRSTQRWTGTSPLLVYRRSEIHQRQAAHDSSSATSPPPSGLLAQRRQTLSGRRLPLALEEKEREAKQPHDASSDATPSVTSTPGTITPEESKEWEEAGGGSPLATARRKLSRPARITTAPSQSSLNPSRLLSPSLIRLHQHPTSASTPNSSSPNPDSVSEDGNERRPSPRVDGRKAFKSPLPQLLAGLTKPALAPSKLALRALVKDERRQEKFGYMFRQLKGELYYFRLLFFISSFGFACVAVLPSDPTLRLFLTGLFFLVDTFIVTAATPFESKWRNFLSAAMSIVGVVQIFVLLALVQLGLSSGDGSLDLGHSATGQKDSQNPSDALTGVSDEAARFELYLGILCIVEALAVAAVHRRRLHRLALHLRGRYRDSPRVQRVVTAVSALVARMRGRTLVRRVVVREKSMAEMSQFRPPPVRADPPPAVSEPVPAVGSDGASVMARALFDYEAVEATELSLVAGERLLIEQVNSRAGWSLVVKQSTGERGWIPTEYVVDRSALTLHTTLTSQHLSMYHDSERRHTQQDTLTGGEEGEGEEGKTQRASTVTAQLGSEDKQQMGGEQSNNTLIAAPAGAGEEEKASAVRGSERADSVVTEDELEPGAVRRSKSIARMGRHKSGTVLRQASAQAEEPPAVGVAERAAH